MHYGYIIVFIHYMNLTCVKLEKKILLKIFNLFWLSSKNTNAVLRKMLACQIKIVFCF